MHVAFFRFFQALVFLFTLGGEGRAFARQRAQTIYGVDSRTEISEVRHEEIRRWIPFTVALVENQDLVAGVEGFWGRQKSLGEEYGLCRQERFFDQPTLSFCTGFRMSANWIVTAKHCVEDLSCAEFKIVDNFSSDKRFTLFFSQQEVQSCKEIRVSKKHDLAFLRMEESGASWRSDDRFKVILDHQLQKNPIGFEILGYPLGLPMKWAEGTLISKQRDHFLASIDSYEGNSGSPIFDKKGRLAGILLGGEEDFDEKESEACKASHSCQLGDHCEGEEIISIEKVDKEFKQINLLSGR